MKTIHPYDIKIRKTCETPRGGAHKDQKSDYQRQEKHPKKSFQSYMEEVK